MAGRTLPLDEVKAALWAARGDKTEAARILGCRRSTLVHYVQRYGELKETCEQIVQARIDLAENRLDKKLDEGFWPAVKFTLSTVGKARGYTERFELSGADGRALAIEHGFRSALDKIYGGGEGEGSSIEGAEPALIEGPSEEGESACESACGSACEDGEVVVSVGPAVLVEGP